MRLAIVSDSPTTTNQVEWNPNYSYSAGTLVAAPEDGTDDVEETDTPPTANGKQRFWRLALEETPTGDGRYFEAGAFSWRDLPLPFMATSETSEGHDGAILVAQIVDIQRQGTEIVGETRDVVSDDPEVLRLQQLMDDGALTGVSVDMDQITGVIEIDTAEVDPFDEGDDGVVRIPIGGDTERMIFSEARIMGATALPFPAFSEARMLSAEAMAASLVAGATSQLVEQPPHLGLIDPPTMPPATWFLDPGLAAPTPLTVDDDGRVYGHLALWNTCHVGFENECVMAPRSATNYASFYGGATIQTDAGRVPVGVITTGAGHADTALGARPAKEHYDHTGFVGADVAIGEDKHGIWVAGAMRPGLNEVQQREFLAAKVSGDWRRINGNLELIGIASVNVPGFPVVRSMVAAGEVQTLIAAAAEPCDTPATRHPAAELIARSIGRHPVQLQAQRDAVAARVGRDWATKAAALRDRVHR